MASTRRISAPTRSWHEATMAESVSSPRGPWMARKSAVNDVSCACGVTRAVASGRWAIETSLGARVSGRVSSHWSSQRRGSAREKLEIFERGRTRVAVSGLASAAAEGLRPSVELHLHDRVEGFNPTHGRRRDSAVDGRNALVSSLDPEAPTFEFGDVCPFPEPHDDGNLSLRFRAFGFSETVGQLSVDL